MKKITIGRGRECDIRLNDSTDKVSRRQAVITVSPMGKMMIYDTSANGTFVNGEKVEKPAGKPIKRGDNVNFAHLVDLDWDQVKNPYKRMWTGLVGFIVVLLIIALVLFIWGDAIFQTEKQKTVETEQVETDSIAPVNDSLKLETPVERAAPAAPKANHKAPKAPAKTQTPPVKPDNKETAKEILKENAPKQNQEPNSHLDEMIKNK